MISLQTNLPDETIEARKQTHLKGVMNHLNNITIEEILLKRLSIVRQLAEKYKKLEADEKRLQKRIKEYEKKEKLWDKFIDDLSAFEEAQKFNYKIKRYPNLVALISEIRPNEIEVNGHPMNINIYPHENDRTREEIILLEAELDFIQSEIDKKSVLFKELFSGDME